MRVGLLEVETWRERLADGKGKGIRAIDKLQDNEVIALLFECELTVHLTLKDPRQVFKVLNLLVLTLVEM